MPRGGGLAASAGGVPGLPQFRMAPCELAPAVAGAEPPHGTGSAKVWPPWPPAMAAGLTDHVWPRQEGLLSRGPPWPQPHAVERVGGCGDREAREAESAYEQIAGGASGQQTRFEVGCPADGPYSGGWGEMAKYYPHPTGTRPLWGKHDVGRQLRRVAQTPTHQEPAAPSGCQARPGEPHPVIPAWAFGPIASAQPVPALRPQRRQEAFDLVLPTSPPDILFPRDGHDIGVVLFFQPHHSRRSSP